MEQIISKAFAELTPEEKQTVYKLVLENNKPHEKSFEEITGYFSGHIFNKGESLFTFWRQGKPFATIGAIVKDVIYKGEIFITAINVQQEYSELFLPAYNLVENYVKAFNPKIIKLGINHYKDYLLPFIEKIGFVNPYHLYEMSFLPSVFKDLPPETSMENLNELNKEIYRKINNSAFSDCPNGGILSTEDMNNFISDYKDKPDLIGLFKYRNDPVGAFELAMSEKTGIIEAIGIDKEYQGQGFGKLLLETVLHKLQQHGAKKIRLSVISTNTKAYNIYLNYGFVVDKILSDWFEKVIVSVKLNENSGIN